MSKSDSVVAVYDTHEQAELAVKELQEAGIDMKKPLHRSERYSYG